MLHSMADRHLFVNNHYFANPFGDENKQIQLKTLYLIKAKLGLSKEHTC